jgi:hypothetical protein
MISTKSITCLTFLLPLSSSLSGLTSAPITKDALLRAAVSGGGRTRHGSGPADRRDGRVRQAGAFCLPCRSIDVLLIARVYSFPFILVVRPIARV